MAKDGRKVEVRRLFGPRTGRNEGRAMDSEEGEGKKEKNSSRRAACFGGPTRRCTSTFPPSFATSVYFFSFFPSPPRLPRCPSHSSRSSQHTACLGGPTRCCTSTFPPSFATSVYFFSFSPWFNVLTEARQGAAPPLSPRPSPHLSTSSPFFPRLLAFLTVPHTALLPAAAASTPTRRRTSTFPPSFATSVYFSFFPSPSRLPHCPSHHSRSSRCAACLGGPTRRRTSTFPPSFATSVYFFSFSPWFNVLTEARQGVAPPLSPRPSPLRSTSSPFFPPLLAFLAVPRTALVPPGARPALDARRGGPSTFPPSFATFVYFFSFFPLPSRLPRCPSHGPCFSRRAACLGGLTRRCPSTFPRSFATSVYFFSFFPSPPRPHSTCSCEVDVRLLLLLFSLASSTSSLSLARPSFLPARGLPWRTYEALHLHFPPVLRHIRLLFLLLAKDEGKVEVQRLVGPP
ncbi:hypothetical protein D5F01_LYC02145 [Larimichthys crocea]|uniref:Uncharacterized protein n=1 Tax=Larimichthys crocea TaxID=215358 RepID=A0A6G0J7P3_LARCR|nr:hypothetical protein D5F01_LYC02145 [Larimichthys crocea]